MVTTQDASIGYAAESVFATGVTPTRWTTFVDESLDWTLSPKQGQGIRVGSRVARSNQWVVPTADGGGDLTVEAQSKGMGLLWNACLGANTSTMVSGSTYQQVFTLGDTPPSLTIQKGIPQSGGTIDAYTFLGSTVAQWEFDFPNGDIATLKPTFDIANLNTSAGGGAAYATPTVTGTGAAPSNLFHFANGTISTGTLTAPTTTVVGSAATSVADVRSGTITVNNNARDDRFNFGASGRKAKQLMGLREITGSIVVEYDATTWAQAYIATTPFSLVVNFSAGALSVGNETLQVILPECRITGGGVPQTNGTDLVTQTLNFSALDNQTAAQPIWVVTRTADTAL